MSGEVSGINLISSLGVPNMFSSFRSIDEVRHKIPKFHSIFVHLPGYLFVVKQYSITDRELYGHIIRSYFFVKLYNFVDSWFYIFLSTFIAIKCVFCTPYRTDSAAFWTSPENAGLLEKPGRRIQW